MFFNYSKLNAYADKSKDSYASANPFAHCILDDAANGLALCDVAEVFPRPNDLKFWEYRNRFEIKMAFNDVYALPDKLRDILLELNSSMFVSFLENLTGIQGIIPDPHYNGGGIHIIKHGGKLGIHNDYNWNAKLQLHRRINVLLYMNLDWKEEYGGHLELWDKDVTKCHQKILPIFNRMVIFNTSDFTPHGHPDPLTCPEHRTRNSIATYYYTSDRPVHEISKAHSTLYKRRPQDPLDEHTEALRKKRAMGRIDDE